jgi:hypothetical protein
MLIYLHNIANNVEGPLTEFYTTTDYCFFQQADQLDRKRGINLKESKGTQQQLVLLQSFVDPVFCAHTSGSSKIKGRNALQLVPSKTSRLKAA